jgi:integrase
MKNPRIKSGRVNGTKTLQKENVEEKVLQYINETFGKSKSVLSQFTLRNNSTRAVAKHCLIYGTGSHGTLHQHIWWIHRFCESINVEPDQLVGECLDKDGRQKPKVVAKVRRQVEDYIAFLRAKGVTRNTVANFVNSIRTLLKVNDVRPGIPTYYSKATVYYYRAPTVDEIQRLMAVAKLREKVIISLLAVGGFRLGTLIKLQYRHVKKDLERSVVPVHVNVEAEITKGKYRGYCTFLNREAVEYLKAYLETRRIGTEKRPPEDIVDESPLIRRRDAKIKPVTARLVQCIIHKLYFKSGLLSRRPGCRKYELSTHSFRKFFRTELALSGVDYDCIEYMMGHKGDRYNDVESRGVEYFRDVYLSSGISLKSKTKETRIETLLEIIRRWELRPEEILKPEVMRK